jgi:hypothetical protein
MASTFAGNKKIRQVGHGYLRRLRPRAATTCGKDADPGIRGLTGTEATESRTGMICFNILHTITYAPNLSPKKVYQ